MSNRDLRAKYGTSAKSKELYNKAIRAEIPAGDVVLDLLHKIHEHRRQIQRGFNRRRPEDILEELEDITQAARDEMIAEIKSRYNIQ